MDKNITKQYFRRAKIINKKATACAREDDESIHATKPILPYDVLFAIFLKLPYYTLARCKFVSKDFNAVISDPKFLARRNHSIIIQAQRQSITTSSPLFKHFRIGFPKVEEIPLEMPNDMSPDPYLVGSCHGLLCFLGFKGNYRVHYVLYNSLTEKWISSPPIDFSGKRFCVIYHKRSTGAYHLLTHVSNGLQFMVHELGTSQWRAVAKENFPYAPLQLKQSTAVAMFGCIYWICHSLIGNARRMILAFDVETEQFSSVKEPPRVRLPNDDSEALTLVETDVGLGYPTFSECTMNIWVMKGRDSAWEKVYAINLKPIQGSLKNTYWDSYPSYVVMQCTMGEIWFTEHGRTTGGNWKFTVYDCNSCTFKSVDLRNWFPGCFRAICYAPCLWKSSISLKAF